MVIDCQKIIHNLVIQHTSELDSKGIKLNISVDESVPLYSYMARLKIILGNLFLNAIQFQNANNEMKWINISITSTSKICVISISDNGIGIDPKNHSKIFQLFFRASEQSSGTGVGLYVVNEMVNKIKGTIVVDSSPGQGSIFKITVPNMVSGRV